MNQVTGALTKSYGPLPGYAWAGLAALAAWLILPRLGGLFGSSSSSSSSTPNPGATASGSLNQGPPGPPGPAGPQAAAAGFPAFEAWLAQGGRPDLQAAMNRGDYVSLEGQYAKEAIAFAKAHPAGVGGPSRQRSIGNRRAQLMTAHHPDLKTPVKYTQTLAAVGGPGNHVASVHAVAARAGVHPARLLALNPHYSGVIRIH